MQKIRCVIEDNVELLIEIEGIGKKRIRMIAESWERVADILTC